MALGNDITLKVGFDIDKFQGELNKTQTALNNYSNNVKSMLKSAFVGFGAVELTRQVIEVTSQFQKFEAILTNTLGSNSEAKKALNDIKDWAVNSPFEVSEITAAYVRWANMGLSPTIDRMAKLGDVASSLGAGFEQTAEAFKDLLVGQTKRIEEVGISATQMNGKIQLSFKGVNLEIEKNKEGVQKALDVYSQLNGVLGTSDAISKTLGGRISNLKDVWAQFLQTAGEGNSGVLYQTVESLTRITASLANLQKEAALIGQALSPFHDLRDVSKETLDYLMKWGRTDTGRPVQELLKFFDQVDFNKIKSDYFGWHEEFINAFLNEGESIADAGVLWDAYYEKRKKAYSEELAASAKVAAEQLTAEKQKAEEAVIAYSKLIAEKNKIVGLRPLQQIQSSTALENATISQPDALPNKVGSPISEEQLERYRRLAREITEIQADLSGETSDFIASMAATIGQSINGNVDFGKAFLSSLAKFAGSFGRQLIALGVAQLALRKSFSNPYAAIAAGVALVAVSSAISSSISGFNSGVGSGSFSGSSGSGGSGVSSTRSDRNSIGNQNNFSLESVIRGQDLWVVLSNYQKNKNKTSSIGG